MWSYMQTPKSISSAAIQISHDGLSFITTTITIFIKIVEFYVSFSQCLGACQNKDKKTSKHKKIENTNKINLTLYTYYNYSNV